MDSTKPEFNSSNSASAISQADTQPNKGSGGTDLVHLDAPANGEIRIVDVQNAEEVKFNFDLRNVRVSAIDVDLVLLFPDNSKLILPGLAMGLLGAKIPKFKSLNDVIPAQDLISAISQVALMDTAPSLHLASVDFVPKKQGGNAEDNKASGDGSEPVEASAAAVIVTPVRPTVMTEKTSGTSASGAKVETVEAGSIAASKMNLAGSSGEPPVPKNPPSSSSSQSTSAAQGNTPFSMKAAELTIKALGMTDSTETPQSNGTILVGGSAGAAAADDTSFASQMDRESLTGGSGNDIIYADDPRFSNNGSAARLLDITITMPLSNITANRATISGLPVGYTILNGSFVNGNWVMPVGTIKPNHFQIQLVYSLPDDSIKPDASGFYNRFTMSVSFDGTDGVGGKGTISAAAVIGLRDATTAADQNFIDPATGTPVVILFRHPAGNIIDAGQGNDTIYAAAGADSISGGVGQNLVHYGNSQSGVSVNLASATGIGGFAEGDQYNDIQSVVGSKFNDTLIGDGQNNTLTGGIGADSLDGGNGEDVADYSGSDVAVTVSLLTGDGIGGDAQGDRLQNIEGLIGTTKDDILTAGSNGSTLFGGQGDDTLVSGTGHDSLVGGSGNNFVDYRNSSSAVIVNLKSNQATGGDAEGDHFFEVRNIGGSLYADSIIGDDSENLLSGNAGDDTLLGGLGNDTLNAGGGNDTIDGQAGINTISYAYANAGTGTTIIMSNTGISTATLGALDQDQFSNIRNVIGSKYTDSIRGNESDNVIDAGLGNDTIDGGLGNDTLIGGGGFDYADFTNTSNGVSVNLASGIANSAESGLDFLQDMSGVFGGAGNDTLDGGNGNDLIDYSYVVSSGTTNGVNGITVTLNSATTANVTGLVASDQDKVLNVEHVIGTSYNDSIGGDANANSLSGAGGHDTLAGFGSSDTLDGGAGNDSLIGTGGSDIMRGGANDDDMLIDQSFLGGSGTIDGGANADTLSFASNSGNLTLTSANFANVITNTEVLDFTSVGTNVTMSLNASDVSSITGQALTAGSTAKLDIFQNAGDSISMATQAGYTFDASTANGVTTYTIYNSTDPHDAAHQLIQVVVH